MQSQQDKPKNHRGWWWKILLCALLLLLIGLAIAIRNINSIMHTRINQALTHYLAAGGSLDAFNIRLLAGRVQLTGLTINAPQEPTATPLLSVDELRLHINPRSLLEGEIVVEQITLEGGSLVLVRDEQGRFSPTQLLRPARQKNSSEPADIDKEKPSSLPAVHLQSIHIKDLAVQLVDRRVSEQWSASLTLDLSIDDLQPLELLKPDGRAGAVDLSLSAIEVDQPPGFGQEPMLTVEKVQLTSPGLDRNAPRLSIGKLLLSDLAATLVRNAKGETNLQRLLAAWKPAVSGETGPASGNPPAAAGGMAMFTFDDIRLSSMALQVVDVIGGQRWRAGWEKMDITATNVSVGDLARREIKADAFRLHLQGAEVDPPPGSELEKLARLEELTLAAKAVDLASPEIVVDQLLMAGLNASIQIDAKGVSNLQKLKPGLRGGGRSAINHASLPKAVNRSPTAEKALPVIRLDQVRLENAALDYRRSTLEGTAYVFPLDKIQLAATGLRIFDHQTTADPASLSISYAIRQPGTLPDAQYGALATVGPLGGSVPRVNAQICYTGVKLDTLGSLVSPATRSTLGAEGFDASLALALDKKSINLYGTVLSDAGISYDAIHVQGPLNSPKVEMGPVFAGVFSHVSGGVFNLGKGGLDAGISVVESGVDVAAKAGSGTWEIGKNIGSNLLKIGTGLIAMDHGQIEKGLLGTTTGTLGLTVKSVADTGKAAGGGLTKSVSRLSGDDGAMRAWDQGIATRHRAAMQQARTALAKMPYPPVTE